jgi:hypothetical protein
MIAARPRHSPMPAPVRAACGEGAARVRREEAAARLRRLRPCPAITDAAAEWGLEKKLRHGDSRMTRLRQFLELLIGAILFAAALMALVALPGFLSDRDSTVPLQSTKMVHQ